MYTATKGAELNFHFQPLRSRDSNGLPSETGLLSAAPTTPTTAAGGTAKTAHWVELSGS